MWALKYAAMVFLLTGCSNPKPAIVVKPSGSAHDEMINGCVLSRGVEVWFVVEVDPEDDDG